MGEPNTSLRAVRQSMRLSQDELARAIRNAGQRAGEPNGCTKRLIQRWEAGLVTTPRGVYVRALEYVTGQPVENLGFKPADETYGMDRGRTMDTGGGAWIPLDDPKAKGPLTGIWLSHYEYESSSRGAMFSNEHYVVIIQHGARLQAAGPGDLEVLGPPRLQPERPPDAVHAGRRDAHLPGQFPLGPVRGALGRLLQSPHYHLLHLGIGDGARHPGTGLIAQPVQPPGQEAGPPLGHGAPADPKPRRDIAVALGAGQHDPRPQRQPLGGLPARGPSLQRLPLGIGQHQRLQPVITHVPSRLRTKGTVTTWLGPETKHASHDDDEAQVRDTRRPAGPAAMRRTREQHQQPRAALLQQLTHPAPPRSWTASRDFKRPV